MIEIYLLKHLLAFKHHKTLSDAATALHLTQPTLSRSMQKLEEAFGVPLFIHEKKRLYLNENGLLAAEYAENILQIQTQMLNQVRALDRLSHTITIGSCAPGALMELSPLLSNAFPHLTVSTEIKTEKDLIAGLKEHIYQMIILNYKPDETTFYAQKCGSEQLCAALIPDHRFASKDCISFKDMNGENFLMAAEVGMWDAIVRNRMPASKFLLQEDIDALMEVATTSTLSSFSTDVTLRVLGAKGNRISVPFSNPEAYTDYYCICLAQEREKYQSWYDILSERKLFI